MNFSNEGGVCGTTRLLKNVMGLWMLQCCRRSWADAGRTFKYGELMETAGREPGSVHLIDPDDPSFVRPDDMTSAIDEFAGGRASRHRPGRAGTENHPGQPRAEGPYRAFGRLEALPARRSEIRVIGGGRGMPAQSIHRRRDRASGHRGPGRSDSAGNIVVQLHATGAAARWPNTRDHHRSFLMKSFDSTGAGGDGTAQAGRFQQYCELALCLTRPRFVPSSKDLWDEPQAAGSAARPVPARYRSNLLGADLRITNFGGGNTSSKIDLPDPFTGKPARVLAVKGSGGDLGSIRNRLRAPLPRQAGPAQIDLPRRAV